MPRPEPRRSNSKARERGRPEGDGRITPRVCAQGRAFSGSSNVMPAGVPPAPVSLRTAEAFGQPGGSDNDWHHAAVGRRRRLQERGFVVDDVQHLQDLNEQFIEAVREDRGPPSSRSCRRTSPTSTARPGRSRAATATRRISTAGGAQPWSSTRSPSISTEPRPSCRRAVPDSPGTYSRYLDVYERRASGWVCVQACVWPLSSED